MKRWLEVALTTTSEHVAAIEAALEALDALAVTLTDAGDNPVLEPGPDETPLWPQPTVTGLFDVSIDPWSIQAALNRQPGLEFSQFAHRYLEDQVWSRTWMRDFKPTRFGQRLWIVPSHCDAPTDAEVVIELDPGLAFGSGTHPTTALCLEFLDQLAALNKNPGWADQTVLDFGCGSGVLAIAAIKLGAARAICVDNDPQALQATKENALRNGVLEQIDIVAADQIQPGSVDVVVSNILAGALIELAPILSRTAKPGAAIALSGILLDQGQPVRRAYEHTCQQFEIWQRQEWLLIRANRLLE